MPAWPKSMEIALQSIRLVRFSMCCALTCGNGVGPCQLCDECDGLPWCLSIKMYRRMCRFGEWKKVWHVLYGVSGGTAVKSCSQVGGAANANKR